MDEDISPATAAGGWGVLHFPWDLLERLPWFEEGSFAAALTGALLLILTVIAITFLSVYVAVRIRAARQRKRDRAERADILRAYADLPPEVTKYLSVRQGVLDARASLLNAFSHEWRELQRVLPDLLDGSLVEETRVRIEGTWSAARRRQFYLRYHVPLSTVMSPRRWEEMFEGSTGVRTTGSTPVIRGIGETTEGMYVVVATAPGWTTHEWDDILPDLRVELDAPDTIVELVNSTEVIIALNDRGLRPPYIPEDTSSDPDEGAPKTSSE